MKKVLLLAALLGGVSFSSMAAPKAVINKSSEVKAEALKTTPKKPSFDPWLQYVEFTLSCGGTYFAVGFTSQQIIQNALAADKAICFTNYL